MADLSTPPRAATSTTDAGAPQPDKQQKARPEKPDEPKYKEDLAKAEKEHAAAQERFVCSTWARVSSILTPSENPLPSGDAD